MSDCIRLEDDTTGFFQVESETVALSDGDLVEVDATRGTIKKMQRRQDG